MVPKEFNVPVPKNWKTSFFLYLTEDLSGEISGIIAQTTLY